MRGVNRRYRMRLLFLLGDRVATYNRETNLLIAFQARTDASLVALCIDQHDVRDMDSGLLLGDAALNVFLRVRLHVLLDHHDTLDENAVFFRDHAKDAALFALVFTGNHFHFVITLNLDACHYSLILDDRVTSEPDSENVVRVSVELIAEWPLMLNNLGCQRYDLKKLL